MQWYVFSIYDRQGQVYFQPFCCRTLAEAKRNFKASVNKPEEIMAKFAGDFDLVCVGMWDDVKGRFTEFENNNHVVNGADLVE